MKKRLLSALLCLCMVVCMMPTISLAANETSGTCGDNVTWSLSDDGTLTISGTGEMTNYQSLKDCPWSSFIQEVVIETGVTSIGDYAFYHCNELTRVTIPDSVTSIGDHAFSECNNLTSMIIPDSVTSIGEYAFYYCRRLINVTIPDSITSIGEYAFAGCSNLTISVTIPDSVTSIENGAFCVCSNLISVMIPDSVTSIGEYAFSRCRKLTSVTIPNSVTSIGDHAFSDCGSLTSVTIPNSVTSIGDYAFSDCSSLSSVVIPDSVTSIGDYAFSWCSNLTSVTIPDSVTSIGDFTFTNCSSLASVTIPNSVTSIRDCAFSDCSSLTSVTIPNSVTSIGDHAFSDCSSLSSVVIPDSVTSIGAWAFHNCTSLRNMTIPESVVQIGRRAFTANWSEKAIPGFTATVTEGSAAETYCKENGVPYKYPSSVNFTDVDKTQYYATPVQWAVEREITNGVGDGAFAPNTVCTRGQIMTFLWRANGEPEPTSTNNPFTDVNINEYYGKAVLWAVEQGITTGTSATTFSPNQGCTRGQVATFLWRAEGKPSSSVSNQFSDVDTSEYYGTAVLWASEKGITNGMGDGTFAPNATCTRGQIVTFLYRAMA